MGSDNLTHDQLMMVLAHTNASESLIKIISDIYQERDRLEARVEELEEGVRRLGVGIQKLKEEWYT